MTRLPASCWPALVRVLLASSADGKTVAAAGPATALTDTTVLVWDFQRLRAGN